MKRKTTTNLASVAIITVVSPLLALAILAAVRTAGGNNNDLLLLLLTLASFTVSGINGFGRRTIKAISVSTAMRTHLAEPSSVGQRFRA
ncbi:MAG: hypothetical protein ABR555_19115 [Pyrinomonadaceae bacterium]